MGQGWRLYSFRQDVLDHAVAWSPHVSACLTARVFEPPRFPGLGTLVTNHMKQQVINSCVGGCFILELFPPRFISVCVFLLP